MIVLTEPSYCTSASFCIKLVLEHGGLICSFQIRVLGRLPTADMFLLPIISAVVLPNGDATEINFIDMELDNWIFKDFVEALSKIGQIIYENNKVLVEFQ